MPKIGYIKYEASNYFTCFYLLFPCTIMQQHHNRLNSHSSIVKMPLLGSEQDTDNLLNSGQLAESKAHITGSLGVSLSLSSEPWDVRWAYTVWFSCVCKNHKLFPSVSVKFVIPVWMQMPPVAASGIFLQKKSALSPKLCSAVWLWLSAKNQVTSQLQTPPSGDRLTCGWILMRARPERNNPPVPFPGALSIVVCTDGR